MRRPETCSVPSSEVFQRNVHPIWEKYSPLKSSRLWKYLPATHPFYIFWRRFPRGGRTYQTAASPDLQTPPPGPPAANPESSDWSHSHLELNRFQIRWQVLKISNSCKVRQDTDNLTNCGATHVFTWKDFLFEICEPEHLSERRIKVFLVHGRFSLSSPKNPHAKAAVVCFPSCYPSKKTMLN